MCRRHDKLTNDCLDMERVVMVYDRSPAPIGRSGLDNTVTGSLRSVSVGNGRAHSSRRTIRDIRLGEERRDLLLRSCHGLQPLFVGFGRELAIRHWRDGVLRLAVGDAVNTSKPAGGGRTTLTPVGGAPALPPGGGTPGGNIDAFCACADVSIAANKSD